jgi:hypothetical protein
MSRFGVHCSYPLHRSQPYRCIHPDGQQPDECYTDAAGVVQPYQYLKVAITTCTRCKTTFWWWIGVRHDNTESRPYFIKPRQVADWKERCRLYPIGGDGRAKIHVSEYTVRCSRDPADVWPLMTRKSAPDAKKPKIHRVVNPA